MIKFTEFKKVFNSVILEDYRANYRIVLSENSAEDENLDEIFLAMRDPSNSEEFINVFLLQDQRITLHTRLDIFCGLKGEIEGIDGCEQTITLIYDDKKTLLEDLTSIIGELTWAQ